MTQYLHPLSYSHISISFSHLVNMTDHMYTICVVLPCCTVCCLLMSLQCKLRPLTHWAKDVFLSLSLHSKGFYVFLLSLCRQLTNGLVGKLH